MGAWRTWLHSLIAAAISSFSTAVTASVVDPQTFNFSGKGMEHILAVGGISAVLSVLALLKQSPLPPAPPPNLSSTIPPK